MIKMNSFSTSDVPEVIRFMVFSLDFVLVLSHELEFITILSYTKYCSI